ncbi:hypothetical protein V502_04487 [Pseudogymnoascus sp. VKM F-4520 (FW-2644)]|nr:hypothetical protein V502_04487 [Pseudogymnoascus sp. VKM F-4520 (FW-2644)]
MPLEDSWVVEEGDDDVRHEGSETSVKQEEYVIPRQDKKATRRPKRTTRSPDPVFIMPSLDYRAVDGSWEGLSSRDDSRSEGSRQRRKSSTPEKHGETRRRSSRQAAQNGSPQKRSHTPDVRPPQRPADGAGSEFLDIMAGHATAMVSFILDVLGKSLRILKTPISYALAVWLLLGLTIMMRNFLTNSIYSSLSPLCRIPGSSLLNLPFCPSGGYDSTSGPSPAAEFDQLISVQGKFEEVLDESAAGVSLPMDMKRGEASIRDLRQLVRYSQLHSKNELVLEFDGFIETARIASYDLQKFNSHIGRAVDNVLATTRWTTRVLEGIQIRDASQGAINNFANSFASKLLAPFQPVKFTESVLLDQYIKHTQIVEEEILKLIDEAQALLMVLNGLEDRLEVIHGIVTRDGHHAIAQREELLSELWTMVGGNRGKLSKTNRQLNLLKQVGVYRKSAYGHVSATILKLQQIGSGLEDLHTSFAQLGDYPSTYPTLHILQRTRANPSAISHTVHNPNAHPCTPVPPPTDAYPYSTAPHHSSGTPPPAPPPSAPPVPSPPPAPPPATPTTRDETSPAPSAAYPSPPYPSAAAAAARTILPARYPAPLAWRARSYSCSSLGVARGTRRAR